jgi:maltooligosyltrehalose trehalohydrolase
MPVAQFPGARNWGYDGVQLYAPHADYGGPEELRRLVNAAHDAGIAVILDVVYNHVGPEGNYLGAFGPYFTDTYRTPWGKAVNYDDAESDEVRRFVIDNALHWVTEYRIDGLRLDAIHGIYDFGARHVLRELADAVHAEGERLGRRIVAIAESDLNDPRVVRPDVCGHALDAQWSDDLHHAIHARLTGEHTGYYRDFGETAQIAKALRERFVYDGRYSVHRRRRHGAPALDVPADRFVVAIQNHDQVGNRATGDRLSTLVSFEARTLAAALYLLSPYVPMLWMGEEYDETNPFLYFVSHSDADLIEAVRKGRREEFKAFGWGESVPDPAAVETFERSKLDRARADTAEGKAMLALYGELLRLRRSESLLRPGDADVSVDRDESGTWIRMTLRPLGDRGAPPKSETTSGRAADHHPSAALVTLFNLSSDPRAVPLITGPHRPSRATRLLGTDDALFRPGAATRPKPDPVADQTADVVVPPLTAAIFRLEYS